MGGDRTSFREGKVRVLHIANLVSPVPVPAPTSHSLLSNDE